MSDWHHDRFRGLLAVAAALFCVPAAAKAQSVRWQSLPQASPAATAPAPGDFQWKVLPNAAPSDAAAEAVQWQAVSEGDSGSGAPNAAADPVQWVVLDPGESEQLEQTLTKTFAAEPTAADAVLSESVAPRLPTSEQLAKAQFRGPEPPTFRSVSRNITYGDTLYPEMGFWIPNMFRQAEEYRFTFTAQLLGNPTNSGVPDWCNWEDFWNKCSDGQFLAEVTPLIWGPLSVGVNYSQQESFVGGRADGSFEQGGQAVGFQVKSNLSNNIGAGVVGFNLWNPYGKGGPNGRYPAPGEEIQADLGRTYLFMGSAAWDLGFWFGSDTPAVLAVTAGIGNGRYKNIFDTQEFWVNYGPYSPIGVVALAFNEHVSIFAEHQGQYNGFGVSYKPFKQVPLTGTFMFRDFQGTYTGVVNCQGGNPDNCRTTVDGRLTLSF